MPPIALHDIVGLLKIFENHARLLLDLCLIYMRRRLKVHLQSSPKVGFLCENARGMMTFHHFETTFLNHDEMSLDTQNAEHDPA